MHPADAQLGALVLSEHGAALFPEITPMNAAHVCWRFSLPGGIEPGGFTVALIDAMCRADPNNLQRLVRAYKGLGSAVYLVKHTDEGADFISGLALTIRHPRFSAGQNAGFDVPAGQSDSADKSEIPAPQLSVFAAEDLSRLLGPDPDRPSRAGEQPPRPSAATWWDMVTGRACRHPAATVEAMGHADRYECPDCGAVLKDRFGRV